MLKKEINYIVSGLERSGTSVMMQMLNMGGIPIAFDESRPPDEHNPKGYFELAGGKIINQLMDGKFDMDSHRGSVVKVTAYGLKFLPPAKQYKIIYMMRNIEEVLNSMHKMGAEIDMEKDKVLFGKLNKLSFEIMETRDDIEYVTVNYHDVIDNARAELEKISQFIGEGFNIESATGAVDAKLYRNRATS